MVIINTFIMRHPDAGGSGGGSGSTPTKKAAKGNVPRKDQDLGDTAKAVSTKWSTETWLTLQYTTQSAFDGRVTDFLKDIADKLTESGDRSPIAQQFINLDKDISKGAKNVKAYIADKFSAEDAHAYYAQFGFVHRNHSWEIPRDHNARLAALNLMVAAIAANGFGSKTYGTTFWTDIRDKYDTAITSAGTADADISGLVGDKILARKHIRKVLNSLVSVIKGNYPEDYKQILRTFGFQKEKY